MFVLPSRRVREQIKGFSLGGGSTGGTYTPHPSTCLVDECTQKHRGGHRNQEDFKLKAMAESDRLMLRLDKIMKRWCVSEKKTGSHVDAVMPLPAV